MIEFQGISMSVEKLGFERSSDSDSVTSGNEAMEIILEAQIYNNPENSPPERVNESACLIQDTNEVANRIHAMATIDMVSLETLL